MLKLRIAMGAALLSAALPVSAIAKQPAAADEGAVRAMIERVYAPYSQPIPEVEEALPDNAPGAAMDGYELPYTQSLDALVTRWSGLMRENEELYMLNSFDWYCQCQDNDPANSKIVKQSYKMSGKDRIDANVFFSSGSFEGVYAGQPLVFRFKREGGAWKLDDLKFHDFTTLRKGLASDIKDATKALARKAH